LPEFQSPHDVFHESKPLIFKWGGERERGEKWGSPPFFFCVLAPLPLSPFTPATQATHILAKMTTELKKIVNPSGDSMVMESKGNYFKGSQ